MILIIEGPDLSGKTTAIEKIAKHFNSGFILKNTYKPKVADDTPILLGHYWSIINVISAWTEEKPNELIILDRFYPSQAVYSYLRGVDEMEHPDIKNLDKYCRDLKVKMIYLDTPLKELNNRYDIREDDHISKDQLKLLRTRYDVYMGITELKVLRIDTRKENWLKRVEEFLNEH